MNDRKRLPIGPLGLAMRSAGRRKVAVVALILGVALIAGILLLVR